MCARAHVKVVRVHLRAVRVHLRALFVSVPAVLVLSVRVKVMRVRLRAVRVPVRVRVAPVRVCERARIFVSSYLVSEREGESLQAWVYRMQAFTCMHRSSPTSRLAQGSTAHLVGLEEVSSGLRLEIVHHQVQGAVRSCTGRSLAVVSHVGVPMVAVQRTVHVG